MSQEIVEDDEELEGDVELEEEVPSVAYSVTSYGSDPEVEGLVSRMRRGDIIVPNFQRGYVWTQREASRFIESLLLGLPVPGVFFATQSGTNKRLVIDGQQRLKSLLFFYDGYFNPRPDSKQRRVFSLTKVQKSLEGKTYKTLEEHDRNRIDTSIIHATTVQQSDESGEDTSLYHIFGRLNSGGRRLTDQELRLALYYGSLIDRIKLLNEDEEWRSIFGRPHSRLKDQEMILRFFALYEDLADYQRPLSEFLNKYAGRNQNAPDQKLDKLSHLFRKSVNVFASSIQERPFRPTKSLNVAVYDSCMVGMANRIANNPDSTPDPASVAHAYKALFLDAEYFEAISRSTADDAFVRRRISKTTEAFNEC